jgi:hypothetical protein
MPALGAELEQKFTEVLTSRAVAAPRGAMEALDPQPGRRPEQDGRPSPCGHRRDLSQDTERLPRRPGVLRQQLELHHEAQPGRRPRSPSRRTENGPGQPPADAIRKGEEYASAIVRGSYRSVCHRCPSGSPGVGPEPLERFSAENAARLATSLARPAQLRTGAIAWPTSRLIPLPALCRPPTSHWRAGARRCRQAPSTAGPAITGELADAGRPAALVVWCRSVPLPPLSAPQQGNHS